MWVLKISFIGRGKTHREREREREDTRWKETQYGTDAGVKRRPCVNRAEVRRVMQHLELPTKHSKRVPEITVDNKLDEKLADDDIDTIKITHVKKGSKKLKQSCRPKKKKFGPEWETKNFFAAKFKVDGGYFSLLQFIEREILPPSVSLYGSLTCSFRHFIILYLMLV